MLRAQRHLEECAQNAHDLFFCCRDKTEIALCPPLSGRLNKRYFPQSGMTQQEVVVATAKRVGLAMPEQSEQPPTTPQ